MNFNRKLYETVEARYKKWQPFGQCVCVYCGCDATTEDHVPAIVNSYCYGLSNYVHIKAPSCRKCNITLCDKPLHTIEDRANYLYNKMEKKHKKLLEMPFWEEYDITQMGPTMQTEIKNSMTMQDAVAEMLEHLDMVRIIYENDLSKGYLKGRDETL